MEKKHTASMYFIAIVLPAALNDNILRYKKWMHEKHGCKVALKSPAHITIIPPFWMEPEAEEPLKSDVHKLAQTISSFWIATANFSAFAPRTIFIEVAPNKILNKLKETVDETFRQRTFANKKENRPFHPHITIATRDIQRTQFDEAWLHFHKKKFAETFLAASLSVLKHNGQIWEVVHSAPFQNSKIG